ncbi:MAG: DUF1559 domain-containing protein [Planctomycetia bacterium]|nr:DUF1559 domain-containing protein [Planctomycetia bacterium]
MKKTGLAVLFLFLWSAGTLLAQETSRVAEALNSWTTQDTMLVVHLDLEKLQLRGIYEDVMDVYKPLFKRTLSTENALTQGLRTAEMVLEEIERRSDLVQKAGGRDVFVLVDMGDMSMPVYGVIPVSSSDSEAIAAVESLLSDFPMVPEEVQKQMDAMLHVGQARNAVVFVPSQFPVEKDLKADYIQEFLSRKTFAINEKFGKALAHTEDCSLNVAFVITNFARGAFPMLLDQARKMEDMPIKFPKASVLMDGLDSVVLGIDIRQNLGKLAILAKDEASAKKLMKLYRIWNKQVLEKVEMVNSHDSLEQAMAMDMVDIYFQAWKPTREGNLILWDVDTFQENFPIVENANVVPMAIAGVAVGLLLPAVHQAREAARRMQYMNNFKQVALAMRNYESHFEKFPSPYTVDESGKPLHSWRVALLPFLEQNALYEQIRLDEPWDSEWNSQFHNLSLAVFQNPKLSLAPGQATIGVVVGADTVFPAPQTEKSKGISVDDISDGTSNTILLVECEPVCWMDPTGDPTYEDVMVSGLISTFRNPFAAMGDVSVQTLDEFLDMEILDKLLRRNDGENAMIPLQND